MKSMDNIFMAAVIVCLILLAFSIIGCFIKKEIARRKYLKKLKIKGEEGERDTAGYLHKVRGRKQLISNIYIPGYSGQNNQRTTEIDMVMVHEKGIFVVENKNYTGWIYGNEEDTNWLLIAGNRKKRYFYSPIRQNQNHIRYLKKLLDPLLGEGIPYISVITFNQNARLKKIRLRGNNVIVCNSSRVRRCLRKYLWLKRKCIKREEIKEASRILEGHADVTKKVKKDHVRDLKHYKK